MATPCNSELTQAPFQTYRDPTTGEWQLEDLPKAAKKFHNVIPFRRSVMSKEDQNKRNTNSKFNS